MQVAFNTDHSLQGLRKSLGHLTSHMIRIDVHPRDANVGDE